MTYSIVSLLLAVSLPLAVGFGASQLMTNSASVYNAFILPPFSPPAYAFGMVWTVLYVLMGFASFLILHAKVEKSKKKLALTVYLGQLCVNFFWTYFFFSLGWKLFAFFWLLFLLVLLLFCMRQFLSVSVGAFVLLVPYLLWSIFATYLNLALYILNG